MSKVFLGFYNWGTQAGLHSQLLRARGWNVVSVVFSDQYKRIGDMHIPMPRTRLLHALSKLILSGVLFLKYFNRDIFVFYGGASFLPRGLDLPILKFFRKRIFFYYMGNDVQGYAVSIKKYRYTNMRSYIKSESRGRIYDARIAKRLAMHKKYADMQIVCAPYLSEFVAGALLAPLVINVDDYSISSALDDGIVKIMHAPTDRGAKGTVYFEAAVDKLIAQGYPVKKILTEGLTHQEIKEAYRDCDIFVDQLLAGWYGTASIEAMATGKPVVCFLRDDYREFCTYFDEIPIINANPDDIYERLEELVKNPSQLKKVGFDSRHYVESYHSSKYVIPILEKLFKH